MAGKCGSKDALLHKWQSITSNDLMFKMITVLLLQVQAAGNGGASAGEKAPPLASPAVRHLAKQYGIDLAAVQGAGPGGRITKGNEGQGRTWQARHTVLAATTHGPHTPCVRTCCTRAWYNRPPMSCSSKHGMNMISGLMFPDVLATTLTASQPLCSIQVTCWRT